MPRKYVPVGPRPPDRGFDGVAALLTERFQAARASKPKVGSKRPKDVANAALSTALKRLKTNFQAPLNGASPGGTPSASSSAAVSSSTAPEELAAATRARRSVVTPSPRSSRVLRSSPPVNRDAIAMAQMAPFDNDDDNAKECSRPISHTGQGMRRVRFIDIVQLRVEDEFTVVIPPVDRFDSAEASKHRAQVDSLFRRIFLEGRGRLSAEEKEAIWEEERSRRSVMRDGKQFVEFHVTVRSYPERTVLSEENLPDSVMKSVVKIGAGLSVTVRGVDRAARALIKFKSMSYLEFYVDRGDGDSVLDNRISFPNSKKNDVRVDYLLEQLGMAKGDASAYVEIMMKYYRSELKHAEAKVKLLEAKSQKLTAKESTNELEGIEKALKKELLNEDNLKSFADELDGYYIRAMEAEVDFSEPTDWLIHPSTTAAFYSILKERFPICSAMFSTAISTKWYREGGSSTDPELHRKERQVLFL